MLSKKTILNGLLKIWLLPITIFARKNHQEAVFNLVCEEMETTDCYLSYRVRKKDSTCIPYIKNMCNSEDFAIVLQGPICEKDNMTIESIKYYKEMYPDSAVILSTWSDEKETLIRECIEAGAIVVRSEKPQFGGILNVNYQIINTRAGIERANIIGKRYVAKTRTDQRVCKPYIFNTLINLLGIFPALNDSNQKERIVTLPVPCGNMFTPFFMSDFFYFGRTEDMMKLFSLELDNREPSASNKLVTRKDFSKYMGAPEIYILKNYIEGVLNIKVTDSIESYWSIVRDYFICVDRAMIDLYINKYDYSHMDHELDGWYFKDDDCSKFLTMKFGFVEWINLYYRRIKYDSSYESLASVPLKWWN